MASNDNQLSLPDSLPNKSGSNEPSRPRLIVVTNKRTGETKIVMNRQQIHPRWTTCRKPVLEDGFPQRIYKPLVAPIKRFRKSSVAVKSSDMLASTRMLDRKADRPKLVALDFINLRSLECPFCRHWFSCLNIKQHIYNETEVGGTSCYALRRAYPNGLDADTAENILQAADRPKFAALDFRKLRSLECPFCHHWFISPNIRQHIYNETEVGGTSCYALRRAYPNGLDADTAENILQAAGYPKQNKTISYRKKKANVTKVCQSTNLPATTHQRNSFGDEPDFEDHICCDSLVTSEILIETDWIRASLKAPSPQSESSNDELNPNPAASQPSTTHNIAEALFQLSNQQTDFSLPSHHDQPAPLTNHPLERFAPVASSIISQFAKSPVPGKSSQTPDKSLCHLCSKQVAESSLLMLPCCNSQATCFWCLMKLSANNKQINCQACGFLITPPS